MAVEFIGMVSTKPGSETDVRPGPAIDPGYLRAFAQAHEEAGFDRVLIGYGSSQPDGLQVAAHAAAHTERLSFLIAHRPGFVAPTVAARAFATLDQFTGGRVAVHVISGGNDHEQRRDGDTLGKEDRYARTDEYLEVLDRAWRSSTPFDHHGRFYSFEDFVSEARPLQQPRIPLYFGGASETAIAVGAKHADVFALWGEPLAETAEQIARVRAAAQAAGRDEPPRISVSFRPILGDTDEEAWERAHGILRSAEANLDVARAIGKRFGLAPETPENAGSQRLLAAAEAGELHDRALWTPIAKAVGAYGNTTALVGSPETVAQALLDYVDLGVTTLLIRGFDPLEDASDYGRRLIPLVRAGAPGSTGTRPTPVAR
jgi:alkanesulfonate monooxygenase